jgi:hypothetical protein
LRRRNRLDTFVAPRPSPALISLLGPVNRLVCLAGIPGLRDLPGLRHIPGVRGLCDVVHIDFPPDDQARLQAAVNPHTAAFLTPNHPEFFTDWMIDKELSTRVAPLMASWATHDVVNGLGGLAQRFWLKNNLIAQIPGEGGAAGKAHSVEWALQGHGVLLHPEGAVGWHGDTIGPLFSGVADMALAAVQLARQRGLQRRVYIAPLVWKLRFTRDLRAALEREMRYVENRLGIGMPPGVDLAERAYAVYSVLLERDAYEWKYKLAHDACYFERQSQLLTHLATMLRDRLHALKTQVHEPLAEIADEMPALLRCAERWLRAQEHANLDSEHVRRIVRTARRLMRLRAGLYRGAHLTQEQVAETIKRLRYDYCFGTLRDTLHRVVPRPAGPRIAHIRVAEPLDVSAAILARPSDDSDLRTALLEALRTRLQRTLDALDPERDAGMPTFCNPFGNTAGATLCSA